MKRFVQPRMVMAVLLACGCQHSFATDYSDGIVVINESQYGKGSGTINYLSPDNSDDYWRYRVFRSVNPGRELGCTSCHGAYHDGKLYVVSKFAKDPSSTVTGGVLTAMDGISLEWLGQIDALDASGKRASGRAFLGVNKYKGYVSSSNGIWIVNLGDLSVTGRVMGSENPNGTDDKPVGDPTGTLYFGQCGAMVHASGKVFAAHQSKGVLVIDPATDMVETVIEMNVVSPDAVVGSLVRSQDGMLWCSVTAYDSDYDCYNTIDKLVKIDPSTLDVSVLSLPADVHGPSTSWAAWSSDTFRASGHSNVLYWTGGADNWFANMEVFKFDIDSGIARRIMDFNDDEDQWKVCCPSIGIDPADGTIYISLFKDVVSTQYVVRSYTEDGVPVSEYPMERSYWFPGQILFPASELSGIAVAEDDGNRDCNGVAFDATYENGALTIRWLADSCGVRDVLICDMSGRQVALFQTEETICHRALDVPSGVYIVSSMGHAAKLAVY